MHRDGEHRGVIAQDIGRAISLMHVQIDHRDPTRTFSVRIPRLHQPSSCDGNIVEHAISRSLGGEGMMSAAGQCATPSGGERLTGGRQGRSDGGQCPRY